MLHINDRIYAVLSADNIHMCVNIHILLLFISNNFPYIERELFQLLYRELDDEDGYYGDDVMYIANILNTSNEINSRVNNHIQSFCDRISAS